MITFTDQFKRPFYVVGVGICISAFAPLVILYSNYQFDAIYHFPPYRMLLALSVTGMFCYMVDLVADLND